MIDPQILRTDPDRIRESQRRRGEDVTVLRLSIRSHAVSTRDMRSAAADMRKLLRATFGGAGGRCWVTSSPSTKDFHPREADTMANLKTAFEAAVAASKQLPEKPDNMTLLKIYALYKQASEGDVDGKRPGMTDFVGRAKFDAWAAIKGKAKNDAMQEYVDLIESLK